MVVLAVSCEPVSERYQGKYRETDRISPSLAQIYPESGLIFSGLARVFPARKNRELMAPDQGTKLRFSGKFW
jgi:hypothetical protein